jgi:beta-1,4-mannosyltransferase
MQHSIVYFPDYAHANPYQTLLYSGIDGIFNAQPGSIDDARLKLQRQAFDNRVIFHLHWEDALYRHLPSAEEAFAECQRFLSELEAFLDGGGLFLWTVHNRAPHDGRYLEVHQSLCEKLAVLADQIHLHSYAALEELERDRALDRGRITVIPHGNYRPLFPNPGRLERTPDAAGRRFLLFGRLGAYKGGEGLVQSFAALPGGQAELVVAGKQIDPIDLTRLPEDVSARITVHNRFVSDGDLLQLFEEADFVVSPYRASLTSGTVLLAMSLARPVIVPGLPTLAELVIDGDNGLVYPEGQPDGLHAALTRAEAMAPEAWRRMAGRAFATARRYDWRVIGHALSGLFYRLIAKPRVRQAPGGGPVGVAEEPL